jgi:hypothetical protein
VEAIQPAQQRRVCLTIDHPGLNRRQSAMMMKAIVDVARFGPQQVP